MSDSEARLQEQAASLQALLDQVAAEAEDIMGKLAEVNERRRRLTRAIDALTATERAVKKRKGDRNHWHVSEAKIAQVYERFREVAATGPVTVTAVAEPGLSRETVRRALAVLRDRQQVRLAGVRKQRGGGSQLYALMPDEPVVPALPNGVQRES